MNGVSGVHLLEVLRCPHAVSEGDGERVQCGLPPHGPSCLPGALGGEPAGDQAHLELRALTATISGPQTEHVAVPGQVDPDRGVERLVADLPVADLEVDRVDQIAAYTPATAVTPRPASPPRPCP